MEQLEVLEAVGGDHAHPIAGADAQAVPERTGEPSDALVQLPPRQTAVTMDDGVAGGVPLRVDGHDVADDPDGAVGR